jgi:hypothetical protein
MPVHRSWSSDQKCYIDTHLESLEKHLLEIFEIHLQWLSILWMKESRMIIPPILLSLDQDGQFDVRAAVQAIHRICRGDEFENREMRRIYGDDLCGSLEILIEA